MSQMEAKILYDNMIKIVTKYAPDRGKVLEVGCGSGDIATILAMRTHSFVYGVDQQRSSILEARSVSDFLENVSYNIGEAEELDFTDNFFDFVYSIRTLHEMADAEKSLKEMQRVLRPGGVLLVIDWTKEAAATILLVPENSFSPKEIKEMACLIGFTHFSISTKNNIYFILVAQK